MEINQNWNWFDYFSEFCNTESNKYINDLDYSHLKQIAFNKTLTITVEICTKFLYYRNFSGDSLGQVEAVDVSDVAKWKQKLI